MAYFSNIYQPLIRADLIGINVENHSKQFKDTEIIHDVICI